jgi:hypothetical protein
MTHHERLSGRGVGKLGDFVTRSFTLNAAALGESFGARPTFEIPFAPGAGSATTRYLDLRLAEPTNTVQIQFIRLERGRIPQRELDAARDIQSRTGRPVVFVVTGRR